MINDIKMAFFCNVFFFSKDMLTIFYLFYFVTTETYDMVMVMAGQFIIINARNIVFQQDIIFCEMQEFTEDGGAIRDESAFFQMLKDFRLGNKTFLLDEKLDNPLFNLSDSSSAQADILEN
jgi:hypothetical protein